MNAHADDAVDTSGIDISEHAKLRASQRLGIIKRVSERVRGLLAEAEPVDVPYVRGAKAYQAGDVTLVVSKDGEVVETLLREGVAADG